MDHTQEGQFCGPCKRSAEAGGSLNFAVQLESIEGAELAAMCMSSESFKKRRPSNEEVFNRMLLRNDPTLAA